MLLSSWGYHFAITPILLCPISARSPSTHRNYRAQLLSHQDGQPVSLSESRKCTLSMVPFATLQELRHALNQVIEGSCHVGSSTYAFLLRECGRFQSVDDGVRLHKHISSKGWDRDTFVGNHLVEMYTKCDAISAAQLSFDNILHHNVYSWTLIIAAYVDSEEAKAVMHLLDQMRQEGVQPNNITFISILGSICTKGTIEQAWRVHAIIIETGQESDVLVGSSLVNTYGKCSRVDEAGVAFQRLPNKNTVTWNALIEAHVHEGKNTVAIELFQSMDSEDILPDKVTFTSALGAYSSEFTLEQGRAMHAAIVENGFEADPVIGTAIIGMYGRSKCLDDAERTFHRMPQRTLGTWNAVISIYSQLKSCVHAIRLFFSFQALGVIPDNISVVNALSACTNVAASIQGKLIHAQIVLYGLSTDTILETALITMYGKCGGLVDAQSIFDKMPSRDAVVWNAMLTAYTQFGHVKESIALFSEMLEADVKPTEVTFVNILSVCGRVGMINEGIKHFLSIRDVYGLIPTTEIYGCMIDLFGRAGLLEEGEQFLAKMPTPNVVVWETLLAACQVHGDLIRGKRVAKRVIELNSKNSAAYILLSNIYAEEGKWDMVTEVRKAMVSKAAREKPAVSVIEVGNVVHEFFAKDKSHPQIVEIYSVLDGLKGHTAKDGCKAQGNGSTFSVADGDLEESVVGYHSVKLAIAYGLLSTSPKSQLRVSKNLRVCLDCHSWMKHVSKITERRIVLWDVKHVHELIDGACSCGDYW